jgi:tetratricopeptide (TPR) repeat protein
MYYDYEYDPSRSMPFFEEALRLSMLCGDINQQCNALLGIARVKVRTGDHSGVKAHTSEAQRLSTLSANLYQAARALWIEALCDTTLGDYQNSVACLHTAQHILSLCGLSGGSLDYNIRICQADVHLRKSEYTQARNIHFEMAETTSNDPTAEGYALALLNIAQVDVIIGASGQDIRKSLDDARNVFNTFNLPPLITGCDMVLADLELREGSFVSARTLLHTCIQSTLGSDIETRLYCLERLADISRWSTSGFHWEFPLLVVYLVHAYQLKEKLALHKGLLFLGDVFILTKDDETAHSLFTAALMGFTHMDIHHSRAQCMLRLGDLAKKQGDLSRAVEFWKESRPLFERSVQAKDIAQIDARLGAVEKIIG